MLVGFKSNCPYQMPFEITLGRVGPFYFSFFESLGYSRRDVVDTSVASEEQRAKFFRWHHHEEDEVRQCIHGTGVFSFQTENGVLNLTVAEGDYIIIPAKTVHRYSGDGEFVRHFKNDLGWEPIFQLA
jgi:1,2-dihydroxy-3-keto-5-methylthiopentene dioxygenase